MSFLRVILDLPNYTQTQIERTLNLKVNGKRQSTRKIADFLGGLAGGARKGVLMVNTGITKATATLTIASTGPTNGQTFTVCGTVFTCVTSGATGNQFNLSTTPATVASRIAAAVNASASTRVTDAVVASASGAVVTFTAFVPGKMGNALVLTNTNLSNTTAVDFNGAGAASNGTTYNLDLS